VVKQTEREESRALLVLEVVFVVMFLAGVALLYVPAALMLGGVAGVLATEREMARQRPVQERGRGREQ
jgi:hypothetical protein